MPAEPSASSIQEACCVLIMLAVKGCGAVTLTVVIAIQSCASVTVAE